VPTLYTVLLNGYKGKSLQIADYLVLYTPPLVLNILPLFLEFMFGFEIVPATFDFPCKFSLKFLEPFGFRDIPVYLLSI